MDELERLTIEAQRAGADVRTEGHRLVIEWDQRKNDDAIWAAIRRAAKDEQKQ